MLLVTIFLLEMFRNRKKIMLYLLYFSLTSSFCKSPIDISFLGFNKHEEELVRRMEDDPTLLTEDDETLLLIDEQEPEDFIMNCPGYRVIYSYFAFASLFFRLSFLLTLQRSKIPMAYKIF